MQPKNAHALNNTWKRQDTTQDLIVWFSGVMPNPSHAWTVRVADSKGYLGDYNATLQGNRFVIDTGQFADFPVGEYVLEVWETYSKDGKAETGIYPNPDSFITFKINKNVVDDDLVKSFDLDEVLGKAAARANKAIVVDGTETLPAGSQAAVESRYDGERVHFTFKIPKGTDGANGDDGKDGNDGATPQIGSNGNWIIAGHDTGKPSVGKTGATGPAPTLSIGSVTKVAPGGNPTASVTGSDGSYTINLGIPEGQRGATGGLLNWTKVDLSTSDYDQNTWYPVVMNTMGRSSAFDEIAVRRPLDNGWGNPSWASHARGFSGAYQYRMLYPFFGSINPICYIDAENSYFVSDNKSPVHCDIHANNGGYVLYMRGGSMYEIGYSASAKSWTPYKSDYSLNTITFSPTTVEPVSFEHMRRVWPSVNVINLQTLTKLGGVSESTLLSGLISTVAKANNVLKSPISWATNNATKSNPSDGVTRFTTSVANASNMGGYWYYPTSTIIPGKRYIFQTMVRGQNCILTKVGEERNANNSIFIPVSEEWQPVSCVFEAKSDIVFYSDVNGDDGYFELDDNKTFIFEVGGVTGTNSLPNLSSAPNLFPGPITPTFEADSEETTQHLSGQRFGYLYNKECIPKENVYIKPFKGDTIMQSCVIRISSNATLDDRITFTFFNSQSEGKSEHHPVTTTITQIGDYEYRVSASYQIQEDNFNLRSMDFWYFGLATASGNGSDAWIEIDQPYVGLVQSGG